VSRPGAIVAELLGGLGNQMFQYAAARGVSLRAGLPLKLDLTGFDSYTRRRFALSPFRIVDTRASTTEIRELRGPVPRLQRHLPGPVRRMVAPSHVAEPHFHFWPGLLDVDRAAYLSGHWQSERYFLDVASAIREDFTFLDSPAGRTAEMLREIRSGRSVSLHVRRGDYLLAPETHSTCSPDYYRAAVAEVTRRSPAARVYVFSDEPPWARANLDLGVPFTVVDHNGPDEGHEDLRLLSACHDHVTANSTFSWWGAWLGTATDKVVIAPRNWFATSVNDTRDLLPPGWMVL
jgi:hypothetical protein